MSFTRIEGSKDPALFQKAAEGSRKIAELNRKEAELRDEMAGAIEQKALESFTWRGKSWPDGVRETIDFEPKELKVMDVSCPDSPLGKCVAPRQHLLSKNGSVFHREYALCLCCERKLVQTLRGGWMSYQDYLAMKKARQSS